jgi:hypothetical protein
MRARAQEMELAQVAEYRKMQREVEE